MLALSVTLLSLAPAPQPPAATPVTDSKLLALFEGVEPQGTVHGPDGAPLSGVRIRIETGSTTEGYAMTLGAALTSRPLPPAISGSDGSWVMPLTAQHRLLLGSAAGQFSLVVDQPGLVPWREPLARGLRGFLGSDVSLRRPAPNEILEVRVEQPAPGMVLAVRTPPDRNNGPSPVHLYPVGEDGVVRVVLPLAPSPALVTSSSYRELGSSAQLLAPGHSTLERSVRQDAKHASWSAPAAGDVRHRPVRVEGGAPLAELRALYRLPGGDLHWFPLPGGELLEDATLQAIAVTADGMRPATELGDEIVLRPPAHPRPHAVPVTGAGGRALPAARGYLWPLEAGVGHGPRGLLARRPLAVLRADDLGVLRVPAASARPAALEVRAPGYLHTVVSPDRADEVALKPLDTQRVIVHTIDGNGADVAGVFVFVADSALRADLRPRRVPRTDEHGRLVLPAVPVGKHRLFCVAAGWADHDLQIEVDASAEVEATIDLHRSKTMQVVTVGGDGRARPFTAIDVNGNMPGNRSYHPLWSDSRGRLVLDGWPRDAGATASVCGLRNQSPLRIDPTSTGTLALEVDPGPMLLALLPPGGIRRSTTTQRGGGQTSGMGRPREPHANAVLMRWSPTPDLALLLGLGSGPPVRITGDDIDASATELVRLDCTATVRRIPMHLGDADPHPLRVQPRSPHYGGAMASNSMGNMVEIDQNGQAWFVARDKGAYTCRVLHPDYLPTDVDVAADATEVALHLRRGVALTFDIPLTDALRQGTSTTLTIKQKGKAGSGYILFAQDYTIADAPPDAKRWLLRSPCALEPGRYEIRLTVNGTTHSKTLTLHPAHPETITFE